MNKVNAEVWICSDGKTMRAGDKSLCIWWDVKNKEQGEAIVKMLGAFTASECNAIFRQKMPINFPQEQS